ncbi:hypothetical protein A2215_01175 [Candidatus Berkelbacteria bacterium RIFOXYA2_FULL_43_10]|uniref:Glycosyltransferase RgtA/B/C/D-like domain-containing protein n=1 Tax=Candidatus Berkelbacteria bacterium RIFOXYA2_FULL_43_10 TaxID=1797472 RepID=A0A1F5EDX3_9BACT|nr:MAG: hypothetical protein A2215_01175 [Candidatus Berkelbacteria bacterium RIFOXYA2_FULL_43_10]
MAKRFFKSNWFVFVLYLILYFLIFSAYRKGIGQFWDWSWPVFDSQLRNIFSIESLSWVSSGLGRPLAYTSNYWSRLLLSSTGYLGLNPEVILYLLIVFMATVSSYFLYLISRIKSDKLLSVTVGLIAILNPAVLYKLISGHMGFFIAYPIFVGLIYFLTSKFKKDLKSYLILGLLLAFVGVQIQFFAFALLFVIVFFLIRKDLYSLKYSIVSVIIALLINLPWLSNFIVGANKVSSFSGQATSVAFDGAMRAKLLNIAVLAFSDATTIKYYFSKIEFAYFGLFTLGLIGIIVIAILRKKLGNILLWFILWAILLISSTGFFHSITFAPFSTFAPIFREVGHLAPIVVLFELSIIANAKIKNKYFYYPLLLYLIIFAVINGYTIATKLPKLDYEFAREKFQSFSTFWESDTSTYRVLSYPFFGQYSYFNQSKKDVRRRLIENSGTDSVMDNSGMESISNYIQPQEVRDSEQYKIVSTHDILGLKEKNVKYIFDFSDIWESNFERYSGAEIYDNDLSLIKNDPEFFEKLISANPGEIKQVADHIYEIVNAKPRIYSDGGAKVEFEKIDTTKYKIKVSNLSNAQNLNFLESYHEGWKIYPSTDNRLSITDKPIFDETHQNILGYANGWTIDPDEIKEELGSDQYQINDDGSIDIDLVLYFEPQNYFVIARTIAVASIFVSVTILLWLSFVRSKKTVGKAE